jgi:hypothetical protein
MLTKLDVARRQLETAVQLYFEESDEVSVHTLAAAAHGILDDISRRQSGRKMLTTGFGFVKPEHVEEWRRNLREAQNFFKHATSDPDAILAFNPELTEAFILDASATYEEMTKICPAAFTMFLCWYSLNHPNLIRLSEEQRVLADKCATTKPSRQTFYLLARRYFLQSGAK